MGIGSSRALPAGPAALPVLLQDGTAELAPAGSGGGHAPFQHHGCKRGGWRPWRGGASGGSGNKASYSKDRREEDSRLREDGGQASRAPSPEKGQGCCDGAREGEAVPNRNSAQGGQGQGTSQGPIRPGKWHR